MSLMFNTHSLFGKTVMVVEDEAILALDLSLTIEDAGARVVGPIHRLEHALQRRTLQDLDAAVLDVDVNGQEVFPLADRLTAAGIPFVFHTGRRETDVLSKSYGQIRVLRKPCLSDQIVETLDRLVEEREHEKAAARTP